MTHQNKFAWNELVTNNAESAIRFYTRLFGWTSEKTNQTGQEYTLFKNAQGQQVGGCMQMQLPEGTRSHWMPYVEVENIDECCEQVGGFGGRVISSPKDIPTIGRFAVIEDPSGALLSLIQTNPAHAQKLQGQPPMSGQTTPSQQPAARH